jgi:hypothetical protein
MDRSGQKVSGGVDCRGGHSRMENNSKRDPGDWSGSVATFDSIRDNSALRPSKLPDRSQQWHCGSCQQVDCFS